MGLGKGTAMARAGVSLAFAVLTLFLVSGAWAEETSTAYVVHREHESQHHTAEPHEPAPAALAREENDDRALEERRAKEKRQHHHDDIHEPAAARLAREANDERLRESETRKAVRRSERGRHVGEESEEEHRGGHTDGPQRPAHRREREHKRRTKHERDSVEAREMELEEISRRRRAHAANEAREHHRRRIVHEVKRRNHERPGHGRHERLHGDKDEDRPGAWRELAKHHHRHRYNDDAVSDDGGNAPDVTNSATEDKVSSTALTVAESKTSHGNHLPVHFRGMYCYRNNNHYGHRYSSMSACHKVGLSTWQVQRGYRHSHHQDVGLCCKSATSTDCERGRNGDWRLSDFYGSNYKRLEYYQNGEWGTMADDYWRWGYGSNDAHNLCRLFGHTHYVSWKRIGKEPEPCDAGNCLHAGHHSRKWKPCHCVCQGIWTGDHCEREIQRDCNSLDNDISEIFARVAHKEDIPLNIMQAAQGLSIDSVRGVPEINHQLRELQGRQHSSNRCVSAMSSSGIIFMAKRVPLETASFFGVDTTYILNNCQTHKDRMLMFMKFQMSPTNDKSSKGTILKKLRHWLDLEGEMPWERNMRIRQQAMKEINNARDSLINQAESMNTKVVGLQTRAAAHRRRISAAILGVGVSESELASAMAAKRGMSFHLDAMEKGMTDFSVQINQAKRNNLGTVQSIRKDLEDNLDKYAQHNNQQGYRTSVERAKEFTKIVNETLYKLRQRNIDIYKKVKKPITKATMALEKFIVSRVYLKNAQQRDLRELRGVIREGTREMKKTNDQDLKAGRKRIEDEAQSTANDRLAKTEKDIQRIMHKYQDFQLNHIDNMQKEYNLQNFIHASLTKSILKEGDEEKKEYKKQIDNIHKVNEAVNHYMVAGEKEQKALQFQANEQENKMHDDFDAVRKFTDKEMDEVQKMAETSNDQKEKQERGKTEAWYKSTLAELEEMQKAVDVKVKSMQDYAQHVKDLFSKRQEILLEHSRDKKKLWDVLERTTQVYDEVERKVPTPEEVQREQEFEVHQMEGECMHIASGVAAQAAHKAATEEVNKHPDLVHDIANGKQLWKQFLNDCRPSNYSIPMGTSGLPDVDVPGAPKNVATSMGRVAGEGNAESGSSGSSPPPVENIYADNEGSGGAAPAGSVSQGKVFPGKAEVETNSGAATALLKMMAMDEQPTPSTPAPSDNTPHIETKPKNTAEETPSKPAPVQHGQGNATDDVHVLKAQAEHLAFHVMAKHHAQVSAMIDVAKEGSRHIAEAVTALHKEAAAASAKPKLNRPVLPSMDTAKPHEGNGTASVVDPFLKDLMQGDNTTDSTIGEELAGGMDDGFGGDLDNITGKMGDIFNDTMDDADLQGVDSDNSTDDSMGGDFSEDDLNLIGADNDTSMVSANFTDSGLNFDGDDGSATNDTAMPDYLGDDDDMADAFGDMGNGTNTGAGVDGAAAGGKVDDLVKSADQMLKSIDGGSSKPTAAKAVPAQHEAPNAPTKSSPAPTKPASAPAKPAPPLPHGGSHQVSPTL